MLLGFAFLRGWIRSCLLSFALQISILINIFLLQWKCYWAETKPENWTIILSLSSGCLVNACNNTIICQNERLIILINDQRQPKYAHHCQHTNNRVNAAKLQKVIKPLEKTFIRNGDTLSNLHIFIAKNQMIIIFRV